MSQKSLIFSIGAAVGIGASLWAIVRTPTSWLSRNIQLTDLVIIGGGLGLVARHWSRRMRGLETTRDAILGTLLLGAVAVFYYLHLLTLTSRLHSVLLGTGLAGLAAIGVYTIRMRRHGR